MNRGPMEGLSREERRRRALELLKAKPAKETARRPVVEGPVGERTPTRVARPTEDRVSPAAEPGSSPTSIREEEATEDSHRHRSKDRRRAAGRAKSIAEGAVGHRGPGQPPARAPSEERAGERPPRLRAIASRVVPRSTGKDTPPRKAIRGKRGLSVSGIDVHYGKVQALRRVSLEVKPGEMVALLGANGAGKTTTLRAISGMVTPSEGQISFDGDHIAGLPSYDVVGLGIAHMPEGRELFPTLTVEENLRFGYYSKLKTAKAHYREQLDKVFQLFPRLLERRNQAAGTLSGGEQQMLTAARALMSGPKLLLVDELSLGLAPMIVADLFNALHEINKEGTSVLIVEQFIHLALANTKRAYVLAKGEVVLEDRSKALADNPDLIEAYLGGEGGNSSHDLPEAEKNGKKGANIGPSARKKAEAGPRRN